MAHAKEVRAITNAAVKTDQIDASTVILFIVFFRKQIGFIICILIFHFKRLATIDIIH